MLQAEIPESSALNPENLVRQLGLKIELAADTDWPLSHSHFVAVARGPASVAGFGSGSDKTTAEIRAIAEYVERASLARFDPQIACTAPFQALNDEALFPPDLGLYAKTPEGLTRFSPADPLEWVEAQELIDGRRMLIPVEFFFPRVRLQRPCLVAETSSGAAAHGTISAAILTGLLEIIERDSLMLFWYRRPPTATLPIEYIEPAPLRNELRSLQALGFVVTVCQLIYDLDLPCFLVVAFRGADFAYGLGCETSPEEALGHAVRELGVRLRWLLSSAPRRILFKSMRSTSTPDDHYALYCRGPLHDVLRSALKQILVLPPATLPPRIANGSVKERLELLAAGLAERGFRIFWRDITAPEVAASGLRVIRVLVPGLIPLHFGFDRLRMGCQRLVGKNSPGRLCTLLPHFLA